MHPSSRQEKYTFVASPAGGSSSTTCDWEVLGCASWSTALLVIDLKALICTRRINSSLHITSAFDVMSFIDVTSHMAFNCGDSSVADVLYSLWITNHICVPLCHYFFTHCEIYLPPLHGLPFRFPCTFSPRPPKYSKFGTVC